MRALKIMRYGRRTTSTTTSEFPPSMNHSFSSTSLCRRQSSLSSTSPEQYLDSWPINDNDTPAGQRYDVNGLFEREESRFVFNGEILFLSSRAFGSNKQSTSISSFVSCLCHSHCSSTIRESWVRWHLSSLRELVSMISGVCVLSEAVRVCRLTRSRRINRLISVTCPNLKAIYGISTSFSSYCSFFCFCRLYIHLFEWWKVLSKYTNRLLVLTLSIHRRDTKPSGRLFDLSKERNRRNRDNDAIRRSRFSCPSDACNCHSEVSFHEEERHRVDRELSSVDPWASRSHWQTFRLDPDVLGVLSSLDDVRHRSYRSQDCVPDCANGHDEALDEGTSTRRGLDSLLPFVIRKCSTSMKCVRISRRNKAFLFIRW